MQTIPSRLNCNQFLRTRLNTTSADKHYSLDSEKWLPLRWWNLESPTTALFTTMLTRTFTLDELLKKVPHWSILLTWDCLAKRPQKRKGKHGYTLMTFTMRCQLISYCTRYNFAFLFRTQPPISVAQMTSSSKKWTQLNQQFHFCGSQDVCSLQCVQK